MNIFDIFLICIGLSMDNMAVAIAGSCTAKEVSLKYNYKVALIFCLTGLIFLLLGWYGGLYLEKYINLWDHWVSFFILLYIGGKMILNFFKEQDLSDNYYDFNKASTLFILALATNIDVFAVGLTLSFYKVSLVFISLFLSFCIIGWTLFGFFAGRKMGLMFGKKATLLGGGILIFIGLKILLQGIFSV